MANKIPRLGFIELKKSLFLLCDIQERFRSSMKYFEPMVVNASRLVKAGKILDVPLIVTEHYPEKLGRIVKDIDVTHAKAIFPKTLFSMVIPELAAKVDSMNVSDIVLFGIETHICLEQTAMDLLGRGYNIHIPADCCMSRTLQDRNIALERLRQIGCLITTSESVIFKLMKSKNHPNFNEVRKLVVEPSADVSLSNIGTGSKL